MLQEVLIDSVRVSLMNYQRVVILKDKNAERYLPIWIGPGEADAIAVKLQDMPVPRPLTHDLLNSMLTGLGAKIEMMVVSDLSNDTFYAKLVVVVNGSQQEFDCRPSDALAMAVRANAPIYVEDIVMEKASITMGRETGATGSEISEENLDRSNRGHKSISGEELKRLSAFEDFIKDLKGLEELGASGENTPS